MERVVAWGSVLPCGAGVWGVWILVGFLEGGWQMILLRGLVGCQAQQCVVPSVADPFVGQQGERHQWMLAFV